MRQFPVHGMWLAVLALGLHGIAAATQPPNIVVIYADDLGYGDLRCYNPDLGKIPTPNIDRLASEGMRFTDGHSSSGVCSPSRYTLLTGRYHWRTRLKKGIVGLWEQSLIEPDRLTIGSLAKTHGYRTGVIGKWHLGWDWPLEPGDKPLLTRGGKEKDKPALAGATDEERASWQRVFSKPIGGGPTTRGFDSYFGTDVPNWPPFCFIEGDRTVGIPSTFPPADDFRNNRASKPGPALEGWRLEDILPTLRDRAVSFVASAAETKQPFLLYLPLTSPHTPLAVNEPWRGASGLDSAYADLVMETDAVVGDVLQAVDRARLTDNTVIVFTSDNGFAPYVGAKELEARGHHPSGPLRGYKGDAWEGGHRVPFIVRYPGVTKAGSICHALVHQADLMATLADILGATLPANAGEDSVSIVPLLRGKDGPVRQHAVSCSSAGVAAIRDGHWKLILGPGGGSWGKARPNDLPLALHDLANDLGETQNLASEHPDRVAAMKAAYDDCVALGRSTPRHSLGSSRP